MEPAESSAARVSLLLGITGCDQMLVEMEEVGVSSRRAEHSFFSLSLAIDFHLENRKLKHCLGPSRQATLSDSAGVL